MIARSISVPTLLLALTLAVGCSSSPSATVAQDPARPLPPGAKLVKNSSGEISVQYEVTEADKAALKSKNSLKAAQAELVVNGLGCPQCASNVDVQLMRLPGVKKADVDLSRGVVTIAMAGERRPSPFQIREAVLDAGFTLVRIQELN